MASKEQLLDDLTTVYKANWDASWAANNEEEVSAAYDRLRTFIEACFEEETDAEDA